MSDFDYSTFLANLTSVPGIYRMLDKDGVVLYVGKAANLHKRVNSYFNKEASSAKTRSLVTQIASVDVTVTRTETEALLLESNLIKSLRPKYNVLLRDDKSYPYIYLDKKHPFPRMEMVRAKKKPLHGTYFGPYPSAATVRDTLSIIQKVFKIRNCRDSFFSARSRPCLQYQIERCSAPCTAYISPENYQQAIKDALRFLEGKSQLILEELVARMENAVNRLDFEAAAVIRDQIKSLRLVQEQQGMVKQEGDADVLAVEARPGFACVQCVSIRNGEILESQSFFPTVPYSSLGFDNEDPKMLLQEVLEAFTAFYYLEVPARIPAEIIIKKGIPDLPMIETLLTKFRGKTCRIRVNPRGSKNRWLDFAENNLQLALEEHQASRATIAKRYEALHRLLKRDLPINRMECFDISHTQGDDTVASCVVFNQEGPQKKEYRKYNIMNISPGDDYAAMGQVLQRRLKRGLETDILPDVIVIDGGKGQVSIALHILEKLQVKQVDVIGIAKGPTRKAGWEHLILSNEEHEVTLPVDSPALHLLQHIRDEAHRFAITVHRAKRQKNQLESSLMTIEGVGSKRRHALLQRFGGIRELAKAPLEEIAKVKGISIELASRIFYHFHP